MKKILLTLTVAASLAFAGTALAAHGGGGGHGGDSGGGSQGSSAGHDGGGSGMGSGGMSSGGMGGSGMGNHDGGMASGGQGGFGHDGGRSQESHMGASGTDRSGMHGAQNSWTGTMSDHMANASMGRHNDRQADAARHNGSLDRHSATNRDQHAGNGQHAGRHTIANSTQTPLTTNQ